MKLTNEIVNVNSFYFPGGSVERALPRSIEYAHNNYTFTDGLQYLVRKGNELIKLFDMNDGRNTYRLRLEHDEWRLISVKPLRAY